MRHLIQFLVVAIALTTGLQPLRQPLLFAEDSFLRLSGEPELTWLKFTLEPLPEREPAKVLLAHDGRIVRRVMADDLGIASTFIQQSHI